ncbi:uncharacterized protein LOC119069971 isoform X2 [Bradysia coprophila]|uniref:uncharacterized protein LOC119069971 isoform X2 n=1 Tax=Bradysia coprophila TaxID=38358 RepID=UPI00187DC979|nr:uncharacterized protein LOC119069971 isoform X2 [Bradysia coprophila]
MEEETINWKGIIFVILIFLGFLYILGILKALLGCCFVRIGEWKYNFLQPAYRYEKASTNDDIEQTESTWTRRVIQKELSSDGEQDDELSRLLKMENEKLKSSARAGVGTSEYNSDSIFDSYNAEEEERDTCFVLAALTESKETLKMLKSQNSESDDTSNDSPTHKHADQIVKSLLKSRLVYRILQKPMGNIDVAASQTYSVRGFFVSINGKQYRFLTQTPFKQYWGIDAQTQNLVAINPPQDLNHAEFNRTYKNKLDVVQANDLMVEPSKDAPCLTVSVQSLSND